jgi:hypothetical protein
VNRRARDDLPDDRLEIQGSDRQRAGRGSWTLVDAKRHPRKITPEGVPNQGGVAIHADVEDVRIGWWLPRGSGRRDPVDVDLKIGSSPIRVRGFIEESREVT